MDRAESAACGGEDGVASEAVAAPGAVGEAAVTVLRDASIVVMNPSFLLFEGECSVSW